MGGKLTDESIEGWLKGRSGWRGKDDTLVKDFECNSFLDSIIFMNRVAALADEYNYRPDIDIRPKRVRVTLSTHDAGDLTQEDLAMAERIDGASSARHQGVSVRPSAKRRKHQQPGALGTFFTRGSTLLRWAG